MVIFKRRVPELSELALSRFLGRARRISGLKKSVDVLVTTNDEMRSLNRRFRGKDKATDVLSFAAADDDMRKKFAGEIAVSGEIAVQNARLLGHAAADEVKILVLHGLLHLRGYDHERDDGEMARRELKLRMRLGLPSGLIERSPVDESVTAGGRGGRPRLDDKFETTPNRNMRRAKAR